MNKIQKIKGFLWIRYEVFDNKNLSSSAKLVYACLMRFMNNETKECYPGIKKIASIIGLHKETVENSLKQLEKENLVYIERKSGRTNHYTILEPPLSESSPIESPSSRRILPTGMQTGKGVEGKQGKVVGENRERNNTYLNNTNLTIPSITIVFEYWNSFNIIIHKQLTDKVKRAINGRLKEKWTVEEISQSIKNYATILKSPEYYWTYKWTLVDFLSRGIDKFKDWDVASNNYRKDKDVNLLRVAEGPK